MIVQVLGVAAALWLFVATWQVWILGFVALIIAAAILPAARAGERWHVPRGLVVLGVYVVAAGVFSLMGRLLWPALSEQWGQFMDQLPRLVENVRGWLGIVDYWLGQWGASLPAPKADKVEGIAGILLGNAMRLTTGVVGAVFELLAVLVIAAYLVIDTREIGHTLLALLPREHRATATRLAPAVLNRIGGYGRGPIGSRCSPASNSAASSAASSRCHSWPAPGRLCAPSGSSRAAAERRGAGRSGPARAGHGGIVLDRANRRWVAPVDEHRFTAGSDAVPETRVEHDSAAPRARRPDRAVSW